MSQVIEKITVKNTDMGYKQDISVKLDSDQKQPFLILTALPGFEFRIVKRSHSERYQLKLHVTKTINCKNGNRINVGTTVSFFPALGIHPNSKRKHESYDYDFSYNRFNPDRCFAPLPTEQWLKWVHSGESFLDWFEKQHKSVSEPSIVQQELPMEITVESTPQPKENSSNSLFNFLIKSGVPKEDAIRHIACQFSK